MDKDIVVDFIVTAIWAAYELTALVAMWVVFGPFAALAKVIIWLVLFERSSQNKNKKGKKK